MRLKFIFTRVLALPICVTVHWAVVKILIGHWSRVLSCGGICYVIALLLWRQFGRANEIRFMWQLLWIRWDRVDCFRRSHLLSTRLKYSAPFDSVNSGLENISKNCNSSEHSFYSLRWSRSSDGSVHFTCVRGGNRSVSFEAVLRIIWSDFWTHPLE